MNSNNLGNYDGRGNSNQPNQLRPFCINSPSDSVEDGPHDECQKRLPPNARPKYPMHLVSASNDRGLCFGIHFLENVKSACTSNSECARRSRGSGCGYENHRNRAAGRGCHGAACSPSVTFGRFWIGTSTLSTSHNVIWMESPIASGACSTHLRCSLVELTRDVNPPTCKNSSAVSSMEPWGMDVSGPSGPTAFTIALSTLRSDAPATHIGTSLMLIFKAIIS